MNLKPGREVLDPLNRHVIVQAVNVGGLVRVKLAGPYGATVYYPASSLRPVK